MARVVVGITLFALDGIMSFAEKLGSYDTCMR